MNMPAVFLFVCFVCFSLSLSLSLSLFEHVLASYTVNGIRKFSTSEMAATVIHSIITSGIDNENSL